MPDISDIQAVLLNDMIKKVLDGGYSCQLDVTRLDEAHTALYRDIVLLIEKQKQHIFETQASTSEIRSVSAELSVTLDENRSFSNDLFTSAKSLSGINSANFENTSRAINKIKNMVLFLSDIKSSSEKTKEFNVQTGREIEEGLSEIKRIIELISGIEQTSKKSVDLAERFAGYVGKISSILKTVNDIARQTEILAFNATIESRRAGSAGKGFGVIAGAIRDLADDSRREVSFVEDVLESINDGLKELRENIDEDYSSVTRSVEHSKAIETNFGRIKSAYAQVEDVIDEVLTVSETQNQLAAQVSEDIAVIEQNAGQVSSGIEIIYRAIGDQQKSIEGLNRLKNSLLNASEELSKRSQQFTFDEQFDMASIRKTAEQSISILEDRILSQQGIGQLIRAAYVRTIDGVKSLHTFFDTVWANDAKGRFIYSNPPEPEEFTNASDREWFQEAAAGRKYISPIYISVTNKKPCVTVSLPIRSPENGIAGVLCADIRLDAAQVNR